MKQSSLDKGLFFVDSVRHGPNGALNVGYHNSGIGPSHIKYKFGMNSTP